MQVVENMKALDILPRLTPDWMDKIDEALNNKPKLPNSFR